MNSPRQLTLDLVDPPSPTFDNFVTGHNAEAVAALRALAAGISAGLIYLWGAPGSGRSHLLQATAAAGSVCRFNGQHVPVFDSRVSGYLVDDVDTVDADAQQRLFVLINEIRGDPRAWLVASGSAAPTQLPLRADLTTRLSWGLVYQVHALTDEEKMGALQSHARLRGLALSPEVASYLMTHLPRDMRTLVAVVDALDRFALSLQRPLTVPLVREWLQSPAA